MHSKKIYQIAENEDQRILMSDGYNFIFNKKTGFFARWGKTKEEDPDYSPFGPELCDIEVTTKCTGVTGKDGISRVCKFCYKSNTPDGINMSFEDFKTIFDKLPRTVGQIAFGADSHATSNPDLFKMMDYCRNNGKNYVVPNITVAEITEETADKLAKVCGAVAVSRYENKDICYNTVKLLTDRGMTQINIHHLVANENYDQLTETLNDRLTDSRLSKLNAIVLLSLKQKGRGKSFTSLPIEKFKKIVDFALDNNISIGFDSCSASKFLQSVKGRENYKNYETCCEPCESTLFSNYINAECISFPCSFTEGTTGWIDGLDVKNCNDFLKDIWYHPRTVAFRNKLLLTAKNNCNNCRECPIFKV